VSVLSSFSFSFFLHRQVFVAGRDVFVLELTPPCFPPFFFFSRSISGIPFGPEGSLPIIQSLVWTFSQGIFTLESLTYLFPCYFFILFLFLFLFLFFVFILASDDPQTNPC